MKEKERERANRQKDRQIERRQDRERQLDREKKVSKREHVSVCVTQRHTERKSDACVCERNIDFALNILLLHGALHVYPIHCMHRYLLQL